MRAATLIFLLILIPLLVPIAQSQTKNDTELTATDGSGDVSLGPQSPQPGFPPSVPSTAATDYVDLKTLRVHDETLDGIRISVGLQSLDESPAAFSGHFIDVRFGAQSTPPVSYTLTWNDYTSLASATSTNRTFNGFASFCFHNAPDQRSSCLPQRVIGSIDYQNKELVAFIPKSSLQGLDPIREGYEAPVTVSMPSGTRLSNFSVDSQGDFWTDRLPDTGEAGPYILQKPTANERLRVRLFTNESAEPGDGPAYPGQPPSSFYLQQQSDFPVVSVEPGAPFPIQIEIRNLNGAKRLVNISVEFEDPQAAGDWPLRIAPSLQIPGNETRIVNLIVNASAQVKHRDSATVRVIARAVGFEDEIGVQTLRLVSSVPPSPAQRKLFLHAIPYPETTALYSPCTLPGPFFGCTGRAFLNTIEEDEYATADDTPISTYNGILGGNGPGITGFTGGVSGAWFELEQPLARDLVLDINQEVTGALKVTGSQAFEGTLTVNLHAGEIYIGGTTVSFTAAEQQKPIPFTFLPLSGSDRIPRDSQPMLEVMITYPYAGASAVFILEAPGVVPRGSFIELPIIPDPRPNNLSVADGDALISLSVKGDHDDFVNPGESRAFNVTLINEGADTDNINITGFIESGKCGIQIKPGQRYRLDGGDSAKLGVLLRANSDAKEGERCKARVEAMSENNPTAFASISLEAIVTNGVDLADDSDNYTVDQESAQKLQREQPDRTPGPGFATSILAALAYFAWRRRRADGA